VKKHLRPSLVATVAAAAIVLLGGAYFAFAPAGAVARAAASTPSAAGQSSSAAVPADDPSPSTSPSPSVSPSPSMSPSPSTSPSPSPSPAPPAALRFVSVAPRAKAANVPFGFVIRVHFSAALAANTPLPVLKPRVPGAWRVEGATLIFVPKGHLPVYTKVIVTLPGGASGILSAQGARLGAAHSTWFTVGGPSSELRLQQLLAELGYLPVRFAVPVAATTAVKAHYVPALGREPGTLDLLSLKPLKGQFIWRYKHIPASLSALWKRGSSTVLIRGALMAFESDHRLASDGVAGRTVWTALLKAASRHLASRRSYDYLEVSMSGTETLSVWRDGRVVYRTPVNTGIASRPTARGTFPVYARYLSTTMSGTNPDGSKYNDPGVPYVAYFNGGDAVHGFLRGSYGWPQSLGCVELPYSAAAVVYRYDPIGTLVHVS
jgi:L,D-transpeptidase catalytic domain